jgi:diguanylate cyclase (GGDEF)-like protein/PAS domain S-box-containing protein
MRDLAGQRTAEAAVRYQAALVAHVSDAIIATDNEGTVTSWNPAAESMYGWTASDAVGRNVAEVIGVDPPLGEAVEAVHQRRDGTAIDARLSVAELRDDRDVVTGRVLVSSDITESKAAEQRHAAVVDSLQEGVVVLRADRTVESMNPVAQRLLGAGAEILYDNTGDTRMVTETGQPLERGKGHITAVRETGVAHEDVTLGLQRGDSTVWLSCTFRPLHTRRGAPYPIVISFRDITESRAAEAALQYQASHDALTGLASRPVIVETIRSFLHGDDRSDSMLTVIFLDLDRFKVVNDSLGHGVGDRMLRVIGGRLQGAVTAIDTVGRLGGDGFLVVARGPRSVDEACALAEELRAAIATPLIIAGRTLTIAASAGVVVVHGSSAHTAEAILRDADVAMYQAKDAGRDCQQIFDSALRERALRRLQLEEDLRTALDSDALFVAYQPLIDLATGRVKATEALLRWNHEDFGPVSPVEFIRIAEETGLIVRLGARVLELACVQTAAWRAEYLDLATLQVAVNLSARQLSDPGLQATVQDVLLRSGLPADALWLEITESMLMDDPDGAIRVLQGLRELGVHLSIDDFGTGYSSLSYLRRFPVEELKIDRSFVVAMASDADDAAIVASVTALAHTLGLTVVAEGIETQAQLDSVRALGIDIAQGYLFSRPAVADDVLAALLNPSPLPALHDASAG